ncbi:hypothetical protein [Candidatus Contubernalis alkaliaceticus]|uniref:hypothetical protein n=1 Tax=Candidatus Contubernalis alkaliaceticus TaxID=338645 RepID=UPI001F4C528D|nr:hypothetical protein [Candidatus Contubernalis alkalaceticus]UNC91920.1 hypothetical protein HUE98_07310 [Candidatus Contubernalis alkalaceticus]
MDAVSSIASFIKNIIGTNLQTDSTQIIPHLFSAKVSKVEGDQVLLKWNNQFISARLETTAKIGETLLLQFNGENDGQQLYKVLARSEQGQQDNYMGWQLLLYPEDKNHPTLFTVRHYKNKAGGLKDPCMDIVFPTSSLGFVGIRFFSFRKPFPCCFLVEKEECGELLQSTAAVWFSGFDKNEFPVTFQQFQVINTNEYLRGSSFLNQKA